MGKQLISPQLDQAPTPAGPPNYLRIETMIKCHNRQLAFEAEK